MLYTELKHHVQLFEDDIAFKLYIHQIISTISKFYTSKDLIKISSKNPVVLNVKYIKQSYRYNCF